MSWLDLVSNAKAIKAIFGEVEPTIGVVDLHEVVLKRIGPTAIYRFDLIEYPENPPLKWIAGNFNRVQLEFSLFDLKDIEIKGLMSRMEVGLSLMKDAQANIVFEVKGKDLHHIIKTEFVDVCKISAYRNEEAELQKGVDS